jgi:hypothetical protein
MVNGKLGTTPHINNRPPEIHISALVLSLKLQSYFLDFTQVPADLAGTGVVCPLALIRRAPDFLQKSFLDSQHVISSLNFDR